MALAAIQAALARLCTDAVAREELRADPGAFARRWGLSAAESESLARGVLGEVEVFARSLRRKRRDEAARFMPLAVAVLGLKFESLFHQYAAVIPLGSARNPALDALDFHRWLLDWSGAALALDERHALRYEVGWLSMQHSAKKFLMLWVLVPDSGAASRSLALWWRWRGKLHHRLVN